MPYSVSPRCTRTVAPGLACDGLRVDDEVEGSRTTVVEQAPSIATAMPIKRARVMRWPERSVVVMRSVVSSQGGSRTAQPVNRWNSSRAATPPPPISTLK